MIGDQAGTMKSRYLVGKQFTKLWEPKVPLRKSKKKIKTIKKNQRIFRNFKIPNKFHKKSQKALKKTSTVGKCLTKKEK